jgi:hypothetical protein
MKWQKVIFRTDFLNAVVVGLFAWLARVSKGKQKFKGE